MCVVGRGCVLRGEVLYLTTGCLDFAVISSSCVLIVLLLHSICYEVFINKNLAFCTHVNLKRKVLKSHDLIFCMTADLHVLLRPC